MTGRVHIAGHFGSLWSYATIAGRLATALASHDMLGRVSNFDDAWHPQWNPLLEWQDPRREATHVLVITAPNHYVGEFATLYGRKNSAIFVSPNTDLVVEDHAETISRFSLAIAPSRYCAATVSKYASLDFMTVLPLGAPIDGSRRAERVAALRRRARSTEPTRVLHFTSDQAWPSRKGTETLVEAWRWLRLNRSLNGATLKIHGPKSLWKEVLYKIADYEVGDSVEYACAPPRGETDAELVKLYDDADLVVSPSRCEGFGMMIMGALVAGVPLLTTCNTGHAEFLAEWPGAWCTVPSPSLGRIAFEEGLAPTLDGPMLGEALGMAMLPQMREWMLTSMAEAGSLGTWTAALSEWVARLKDWMEDS